MTLSETLSQWLKECEAATPNWVADWDPENQSNWIRAIIHENGSSAYIFADGISPLAPKYKKANIEFTCNARTRLPVAIRALQVAVEGLGFASSAEHEGGCLDAYKGPCDCAVSVAREALAEIEKVLGG